MPRQSENLHTAGMYPYPDPRFFQLDIKRILDASGLRSDDPELLHWLTHNIKDFAGSGPRPKRRVSLRPSSVRNYILSIKKAATALVDALSMFRPQRTERAFFERDCAISKVRRHMGPINQLDPTEDGGPLPRLAFASTKLDRLYNMLFTLIEATERALQEDDFRRKAPTRRRDYHMDHFIWALARRFEEATGGNRRATAWRDPISGEPSGKFYCFVEAVFEELNRIYGPGSYRCPSVDTVRRALAKRNSPGALLIADAERRAIEWRRYQLAVSKQIRGY